MKTRWTALFLSCSATILFSSACAAPQRATATPLPNPPVAGSAPKAAASPWQEVLLAEHPLVGRIFSTSKSAFVSRGDLDDSTRKARFLLLGEKHDNRDHHRMQAELVRESLSSGTTGAVAFEMLDRGQQSTVDQYLTSNPSNVDGLAAQVHWDQTGWPDWAMYRPVFAAALEGKARLVSANLSREDAMTIARKGQEAPVLAALTLPPLPETQLSVLEKAMRGSHCGMLPERAVPGMVLAQRARDTVIAQQVIGAAGAKGVVLIAGTEHVRKDRGAPVALAASGATGILSVAFVEVDRGHNDPKDYVDEVDVGVAPFDFLWFTPRVDENDPCEQMRAPSSAK